MCNFWSCIIDRNVKVWHDGNSSSHEDALKKSGLKDDKLEDRDFVRIEIVPKKHINHAKARMEVWKKGYGLYCGVNGKLYVYCKGKPSKGKVR